MNAYMDPTVPPPPGQWKVVVTHERDSTDYSILSRFPQPPSAELYCTVEGCPQELVTSVWKGPETPEGLTTIERRVSRHQEEEHPALVPVFTANGWVPFGKLTPAA